MSLELEEGPATHLPTEVFKGHTNKAGTVAYFNNGTLVNRQHDSHLEADGGLVDEKKAVSGVGGTTLWDSESTGAVVWGTKEALGWSVAFSASQGKDGVLLDAESGNHCGLASM